MKITFLGTGTSQGVPVIGCECEVCRSMDYRDQRLRSSVHVAIFGKSIVIDTGPDFRQQMLREDIRSLHAVLFTHGHKDHTAGLDDVRAYNFLQKIDMPVFGQPHLLNQIRIDYSYAFENQKYPGIPRLALKEVNTEAFDVADGVTVVPLPVLHLQMPVLGFRIGDFSYITDANSIPEETYSKLKGTRVLVLNALQREKHISHFNLEEAIDVSRKIGAVATYFTHISHKLGYHKAVSAELPAGVFLAYDGLKVNV